jgi:uncharacterized protein YciI
MKIILTLVIVISLTISIFSQTANPNFDADLASTLGADEYGMKTYVLAILKTGSNESADKTYRDSCFRGHMNNINRLVQAGKMVVAGPMGQNDNSVRGIFILDVSTLEDAADLLQADAAINAKLLATELYIWYGPAALATYREASDKVWKVKP